MAGGSRPIIPKTWRPKAALLRARLRPCLYSELAARVLASPALIDRPSQ
jgi:hypothetical protein